MAIAKRIQDSHIKALQDANDILNRQNVDLRRQLAGLEIINSNLMAEDSKPCAAAQESPGKRRHATPAGPNFSDDIFPPGCGPMELVWTISRGNGPVTIGWQGDSFHAFTSKLDAITWLLRIADRIANDKIPEQD